MSQGERLHHLDGLRALTMLLILPAHALALIGLNRGWNDLESSLFWVIHVFRLPLFFLVAGFFGALLASARGVRALARNRAVRIGIPLLVGVVAVVPILNLELQSVAAPANRHGAQDLGAFTELQPSYLWFLWYLTLLYAGGLLLRRALAEAPRARRSLIAAGSRLLPHSIAPLLLALPCALLLYRQPTWLADPPAESFLPRFDLLGYYAIFFLCGWIVFAGPGLRAAIESRPSRYLVLAALSLPPALALYLLQSEPAIGNSRWLHLLALMLLSISTWSLAFGLLGAAGRYLREPSPRLRYWADASYWIYLSHFPVMAAIAIALFAVPMATWMQFLVLIGATLGLVYPAYGAFVRHSAVGHILHGQRPTRTVPTLGLAAEAVPATEIRVTRPAAAAERRA